MFWRKQTPKFEQVLDLSDIEVLRAFKKVVGYTYAYQFWLRYLDSDIQIKKIICAELQKDLEEMT